MHDTYCDDCLALTEPDAEDALASNGELPANPDTARDAIEWHALDLYDQGAHVRCSRHLPVGF